MREQIILKKKLSAAFGAAVIALSLVLGGCGEQEIVLDSEKEIRSEEVPSEEIPSDREDGEADADRTEEIMVSTKCITYHADGRISHVTEWEYDSAGNRIKDTRYYFDSRMNKRYEYEMEYDDAGNVTKSIEYAYDGSVDKYTEWEYEYDDAGNWTKQTAYHSDGSLDRWEMREYDDKEELIKYICYNSDGGITYWNEWEYDNAGNQIKRISYESDGSIFSLYESEYDSTGNKTKMLERGPGGRLRGWREFEHDAAGNTVKIIVYSSDDRILYWDEDEYDRAGNWTKSISYGSDGRVLEHMEWEYDSAGNKTMQVIYDSDGSILSKCEWEYDKAGNLTKGAKYDSDGNSLGRTEREYDSAGNEIKVTNYDSDGNILRWREYEYDKVKVLTAPEAWSEGVPNVCQTDDTKITYSEGFYYYQSAADHYYLYRSDESGENGECLAKQVPKEIYVMGDWVYFTNLSQGSRLFRIKTDGSGMEQVCGEKIKRFLPMEGKFYCLTETEDGGRIFSCEEDGETETLFEGKCSWLCTDGELLYFDAESEQEEAESQAVSGEKETFSRTVAIDKEGEVREEYPTVLKRLFPTSKYLYYLEKRVSGKQHVREIVRLEKQTGGMKRYRLPDAEIVRWEDISCAVCQGEVYVFLYNYDAHSYHIFQVQEETEEFAEICSQKMKGEDTLYSKAEGIWLVNGRFFYKSYAGEGSGQLWRMLDLSGGDETLFEGMGEPAAVTITYDEWRGSTIFREGYVEQDIEYSGRKEDGQGCFLETRLTLPRIGKEVPAADVINGKIREEAEQFYEEQCAFHETEEVRREMVAAGGDTSYGSLFCRRAYADEHYVSIVYRKELYAYGIGHREYVTRLYSAQTGKELQPHDLFCVDWEEASLYLSFLLRRTEFGFEFWDSDLFSLDEAGDEVFYCLTENGLEIFVKEEHMRFPETHLMFPYEELEDIWAAKMSI